MDSIIGLKSNVFLAPMAGITDYPFRKLVASKGKANLYSEMVAVNAINRKNPKTYRIADVRQEPYPVIVQLVGNDAALFSEAAKLAADLGAYSLDINMGCPVRKIVNNESGSALMKDMPRAAKIIEATVKATPLKVSVKFRKGWDNDHVNAVEFAQMCEQSGAHRIAVHGRTRAQGYSGDADWNIIKEVKQAVKIPVIGNGDITTPQKAAEMIEKCGVDGVMIGRALLGNPWLLNKTHQYLEGGRAAADQTTSDIKKMLLKHLNLLIEYYGEKGGISISRKHISWYVRGLYEAKRFREQYTKLTDTDSIRKLIESYFTEVESR